MQEHVHVDFSKPIQYNGFVDIRFADLDLYGHVNSKHYIDLVSTVRLNFMAQEMKISLEDCAKKGFGFYMTKAVINYLRPIVGLQRVKVNSYASDIREKKLCSSAFKS